MLIGITATSNILPWRGGYYGGYYGGLGIGYGGVAFYPGYLGSPWVGYGITYPAFPPSYYNNSYGAIRRNEDRVDKANLQEENAILRKKIAEAEISNPNAGKNQNNYRNRRR